MSKLFLANSYVICLEVNKHYRKILKNFKTDLFFKLELNLSLKLASTLVTGFLIFSIIIDILQLSLH